MLALPLQQLKGAPLDATEADAQHALQLVQAGHGFAAGDLVYPVSSSVWAKAQADAAAKVALGCVLALSGTTTVFIATIPGTIVAVPGHGLVERATYYLSQVSAGAAVYPAPTSGVIQPVFYVHSSSHLEWVGLPQLFTEI